MGTDLLQALSFALRPRRREFAIAGMQAVVGGTSEEHRARVLACKHLMATGRASELTFRPWELSKIPVFGEAHLQAASASGRGTLISYPHCGPMMGWTRISGYFDQLFVVAGEWLLEDPPPGYEGYQVERRRRILAESGFALVTARGSKPLLTQALASGEAVLLGMDAPGSVPTQFLGKTVEMAGGTARLALATGALVVPAALLPHGRRWAVHVAEAIEPGDFSSAFDLQQELAQAVGRLVMRAPESLESPLRIGGWAQATRDGWRARA